MLLKQIKDYSHDVSLNPPLAALKLLCGAKEASDMMTALVDMLFIKSKSTREQNNEAHGIVLTLVNTLPDSEIKEWNQIRQSAMKDTVLIKVARLDWEAARLTLSTGSNWTSWSDVAEALLRRKDINPNLTNGQGHTALSLAVYNYNFRMVSVLLQCPRVNPHQQINVCISVKKLRGGREDERVSGTVLDLNITILKDEFKYLDKNDHSTLVSIMKLLLDRNVAHHVFCPPFLEEIINSHQLVRIKGTFTKDFFKKLTEKEDKDVTSWLQHSYKKAADALSALEKIFGKEFITETLARTVTVPTKESDVASRADEKADAKSDGPRKRG